MTAYLYYLWNISSKHSILVIHLALLNIVIGGIQMRELYDGVLKPVSLSNDWAGLIGLNRNEMNLSWWIIFYTLASFFYYDSIY